MNNPATLSMNLLTVEQVLVYLKELFETNPILGDLWVMGEISNLSRSAAGHVYFTLKDGGGQLRCAFFRRANSGVTLDHGDAVVAHGRVSIYEQRGELNFIVDFVHPQGAGILHAQFERLRQMLEEEGLFDPARKRPLPPFPRRIGVVTSPTGAVLHDISTIVGRRWPLAEIVLAPSLVQGDSAAPQIVRAIHDLNERGEVDVIIVARGGGSMEELWPFNEEAVQRAIYASKVPVVSAVGHETDFTLADFTADLRAPTPSAAAELVVPDQIEIAMRVGMIAGRLESSIRYEIESRQDRVERRAEEIWRARPDIPGHLARLKALLERAQDRLQHRLAERRNAVEARALQLASLSPIAVLERGYAVVHHADGRLVAGAFDAQDGERIGVRMHDGSFAADVHTKRGTLDGGTGEL
jgi:exodeoxyribonuclease VII large subunit